MKQKFIKAAWPISIIAILIIGYLLYCSYFFSEYGNIKSSLYSLIRIILLIIILLVLVFSLVRLKKQNNKFKFNLCAKIEIILLIIMLLLTGYIIHENSHFFSVLKRQDEIEKMVESQVNQIDDMFNDYQQFSDERVEAYEQNLRSIENNKDYYYNDYINAQLNKYEVDDLVEKFSIEIKISKEFEEEYSKWKDDILGLNNTIGLIKLLPRVKEIGVELEKAKKYCQDKDLKRDEGRNNGEWDYYTLDINEKILNKFSEKGNSINFISVILTIFLILMSLIPYFVTLRDPNSKGLWLILKDLWRELTHRRELTHKGPDGIDNNDDGIYI